MTEYKFKNCTVRIHGEPDKENLKTASEDFMKKTERKRNEKKKQLQKKTA